MGQRTSAGNTSSTASHNRLNQVTGLLTTAVNGSSAQANLSYDSNGNLTQVATVPVQGGGGSTTQYAYDDSDRLTSVIVPQSNTHSLIWFLTGDAQLSAHARQLIETEDHRLYVSIASLWEMAIKVSIGKLSLQQPFAGIFPHQLMNNDIEVLDIAVDHLKVVCTLPFHHRDPFDRLIIAQAQTEQLPIISTDAVFDDYDIKREW